MPNRPKTSPIFFPKINSSCALFNLNNNNSSPDIFERVNKNNRKEASYNKNNKNTIKNNEVLTLSQRSKLNIEGNDMNLKKNFVRNKIEQNLERNNIRSNSYKIKNKNNNYFQHTNNFGMEKNIQKTKNLENNNKINKMNDHINQLIRSNDLILIDKDSNNANRNINNFPKNQSHFRQSNKKMINNIHKQSKIIIKYIYSKDKIKTQEPLKINTNSTFINIIYLLDTTYSMEKTKI